MTDVIKIVFSAVLDGQMPALRISFAKDQLAAGLGVNHDDITVELTKATEQEEKWVARNA